MGVKRRQLILFGGTLLSTGFIQTSLLGQNASQIRTILKSITLRVITPGPSGSGIIVRKSGNVYLFLTAKHVLENASAEEEVYVVTFDGRQHLINLSTSKKAPSSDLAIASFTSSKNYTIASLGNSDQIQELDSIFVAGFPLATTSVPNPNIKISRGAIEQLGTQTDGYGLGYSANTQPGMSGGPVINQQGKLIAIHGRADGERIGNVRVKQGSNWAVPINTAISAFDLNNSSTVVKDPQKEHSDNGLTTLSFEVVTVDHRGNVIKHQQESAQYFQENLGQGIELDLAIIPAGSFTMGSPEEEEGSYIYERPQHQVRLKKFAIGKYPVTQAQWQAIMSDNPSQFLGDLRPVDRVSWQDAVEFCNKLSQQTGKEYRLPSESEWEYACRAGTSTPFHFGETITTDLVNFDGAFTYAIAPPGESRQQTTDVGTFPSNAFGVYDMHGNVYEWCQDHWHSNYNGAPSDGTAWLTGEDSNVRIRRGGAWYYDPGSCRSSVRVFSEPEKRHHTGFRIALSLP